ncbi:MAG: PglZ domain-containing protein [Methanotrichaceae archaeon]|nr:PglZ domain-containing protein [Methanotrichaceae archaeon]
MIGKVSGYLRSIIKRQVDDKGIVVWYDPEGHYQQFVKSLDLPGTPLVKYYGSFFALRHRIDPFLSLSDPPRLIVYVPLDRSQTHDALVEAEAAGVIIFPGAQPRPRNTRLSVVAKAALRGKMGDQELTQIEKQIDSGKLSLADLDRMADGGPGSSRGLLSLIFGTSSPHDVALRFLSGEQYDEEILKKEALPELASLLLSEFELAAQECESAKDLKERLARHILTTDFLKALQGNTPQQLASLKIASEPAARKACIGLAKAWRLRRDLRDSYVAASNQVSANLSLSKLSLNTDQILNVETFLETEQALQSMVEDALARAQEARADLVEIAEQHQSGFWSEQPVVQARWSTISVAGQVLLEADRVEKELRLCQESAKSIFAAYVAGERPWLLLDSSYRNMEKRFNNLDLEIGDNLEHLIIRARQRYMEATSKMLECFLHSYQQVGFQIPGVLRQTEIFESQVKPALAEGKTAYLWADALRFEMARELLQTLNSEFQGELKPGIASAPTITEIGMACLLPGASSCQVIKASEGKLALQIDGTIIRDRADRVRFLRDKTGAKLFEGDLDSLLPRPVRAVSKAIMDADLILITSQEIDNLCESDNISLARTFMNDLLSRLQKAIRNLSRLGVKKIIVTADHGYLFGEELGVDMSIDPPGGDTADLHRRVWIGRGGSSGPAYLRARLSDLGQVGDLEMATPWGLACFRAKSKSKAYFHGGLSPQELIIPVLTLMPMAIEKKSSGDIIWSVDYGGRNLSTRFFSVNISAKTGHSLSCIEPYRIRLELREHGVCISKAISASYGFEDATGEIQMKNEEKEPWTMEPNTITLQITKDPSEKKVSLHLLDALKDLELATAKSIDVSIQKY